MSRDVTHAHTETMPQYVSDRARDARSEPESGASIEVAIRVPTNRLDDTAEWVESHGGSVTDRVTIGLIEATLPEAEVDALCNLEYVDAVEATSDHISVLGPGN